MTKRNGKVSAETETLVPPHDLDAERAVIGAMLVSEVVVSVVGRILSREDFYSETHRVIYDAMSRLSAQHAPVDQLTLTNELRGLGELDRIGGRSYVFRLVESVPTATHADRYAAIVRDKANLRRMIDVASRIYQSAYKETHDVPQILDEAEQLLYQIGDRTADSGELRALAELAPDAIDEAQLLYEAGGTITGTPMASLTSTS